jgi:hypothetical protein
MSPLGERISGFGKEHRAGSCLLFIGRAMEIKNPVSGIEAGFREVYSIVSSGGPVEWAESSRFRYG